MIVLKLKVLDFYLFICLYYHKNPLKHPWALNWKCVKRGGGLLRELYKWLEFICDISTKVGVGCYVRMGSWVDVYGNTSLICNWLFTHDGNYDLLWFINCLWIIPRVYCHCAWERERERERESLCSYLFSLILYINVYGCVGVIFNYIFVLILLE